jgi:hypothetical protein
MTQARIPIPSFRIEGFVINVNVGCWLVQEKLVVPDAPVRPLFFRKLAPVNSRSSPARS